MSWLGSPGVYLPLASSFLGAVQTATGLMHTRQALYPRASPPASCVHAWQDGVCLHICVHVSICAQALVEAGEQLGSQVVKTKPDQLAHSPHRLLLGESWVLDVRHDRYSDLEP